MRAVLGSPRHGDALMHKVTTRVPHASESKAVAMTQGPASTRAESHTGKSSCNFHGITLNCSFETLNAFIRATIQLVSLPSVQLTLLPGEMPLGSRLYGQAQPGMPSIRTSSTPRIPSGFNREDPVRTGRLNREEQVHTDRFDPGFSSLDNRVSQNTSKVQEIKTTVATTRRNTISFAHTAPRNAMQ